MDSTGAMAFPEAANNLISRTCETVQFQVPSNMRIISTIRKRIRQFAHTMPFTASQLDDISIAVGEAAANAMKYGNNRLDSNTIKIELKRHANVLRVLISDRGPGFDPSKVCPPDIGDLRECGRGILCMSALMDEVIFHSLSPGTCVELVKRAGD